MGTNIELDESLIEQALKISGLKTKKDIVNEALKQYVASLELRRMLPKSGESPYDPPFVEKILKGREDIKNGNGVKIAVEDLWK